MKNWMRILVGVGLLLVVGDVYGQGITLFFPAGDFSGTPDRFGNVYRVGPSSAILSTPIGDPALENVNIEEDGLWSIWTFIGNTMLISHAPGYFENAPELTADITIGTAGKYEVILNFIENNTTAGTGPIQAALGSAPLTYYDANNTDRATGGVGLAYPFAGTTVGSAWWYSVSLGTVDVASGGVIRVRVDDVPGDQFNVIATPETGSVFQGITLRVVEFQGALPEIQINPLSPDWTTDVGGNQYRTWPADEAAYPTQADWLRVNARADGTGTWNTRNLGPYGPILESFPVNGNDAMALRTSVKFAHAGTFEVILNIGDTAAADPVQNAGEPNPLIFGYEGQELRTYVPDDGVFRGTPGYNNYEITIGTLTVTDGQQVDFIIDDDPDFPSVYRSVYLGMKFVLQSTGVESWKQY